MSSVSESSATSAEETLIQKSMDQVCRLSGFSDRSSVQISRLQGGCSNQLFVCESSTSGSKVVIRWYGSDLTGEGNNHKPMSEEVEEQVMRRLSLTGLYPRLLLTFPGGRIEDFVSGRTPTITEINCPVVNLILMRKLATIHSMSHMPVDYSKPMFSFTTLHKYLRDMDNCVVQIDAGDEEAYQFVRSFDARSELEWLEQLFPSIRSRVVFCHNDMHKGNVLLDSDVPLDPNNNSFPEDSIRIMDFEYSSANYRWADLSIHLIELSFQSYDWDRDQLMVPLPDDTFVRSLLSCYLDEWRSLNQDKADIHGLDSLHHLEHEVRFGYMVIHLARVLFFCGYVGRNYGTLQNWKYTRKRVQEFLKAKQRFLARDQVTGQD